MKKLSEIDASDFAIIQNRLNGLYGFDNAEGLAQSFVSIIYEHFKSSILLSRLFTTVPYGALSAEDRQLVNRKLDALGLSPRLNEQTPVLTLLGTRGHEPAWNDRYKSTGFRCIPLVSGGYVESLSMLSRQFRTMGIDFRIFDDWASMFLARGRADNCSGMLYVKDAAIEKDEKGRMVVPRQDFVSQYNIRTVFGIGTGYSDHPALVTLFVFTNEILEKLVLDPFGSIMEIYKSMSEKLVENNKFFGNG